MMAKLRIESSFSMSGAGDGGGGVLQGVKKQASGRQPRRAAFWKAQPIQLIGEHLQKPHNAGSRPQAPFFNTLLKGVYSFGLTPLSKTISPPTWSV